MKSLAYISGVSGVLGELESQGQRFAAEPQGCAFQRIEVENSVVFWDLNAFEDFVSEGGAEDFPGDGEVVRSFLGRAGVEHSLEVGSVEAILFVFEGFLIFFLLLQHFHHLRHSFVEFSVNFVEVDPWDDHSSIFFDGVRVLFADFLLL